jgi:1,4-dihydroxy-6-naphthoate synthase
MSIQAVNASGADKAQKLSLAYSTDLDDAFMFWPLAGGRLDARAFGFDAVTHVRSDTATLNRWARERQHDVVAVSIAVWPELARDWLLLPHGGSVGRGYGPVIVAPSLINVDQLAGLRVGVPGASTTCARLLSLLAPDAQQVEVPSAPLERAFAALADHSVDACALIHEGRLTYASRGLHLVCDLGDWWQKTRGLPLPLGGNVIRRALGDDTIARASAMIRASISYARAHREAALDELAGDRGLCRAQADEYLRLYANDDTLDYGADGRRAIAALVGDVAFAP